MNDDARLDELQAGHVYLARAGSMDYEARLDFEAPELRPGIPRTPALLALRGLFRQAGLDAARYGSAAWNPLAGSIPRGSRVLLKPNWVFHVNHSGQGLTSLVTHTRLIEAVLHYVVKAGPVSVVVGDAPLQGCDFSRLTRNLDLDRLPAIASGTATEISVRDLRCVHLTHRAAPQVRNPGRDYTDYALVDLGTDSLLEPISGDAAGFRVTMYDPREMLRNHEPGRHRYLVAREVLDADVVINLPKLKTHKKACITGALKNMVGINGHKEFLPHHRKGGSARGGDCYSGDSSLKRLAEELLDIGNRSGNTGVRYLLPRLGRVAVGAGTLLGGDDNIEGSWFGNDTVWRTCLDLQRVLYYGRRDGTMGETPQRSVLSITDAIVAGEGEGPLAPSPVDLGLLSLGTNTVTVEWVHAVLMGLDPLRIPLLREARSIERWPLVAADPGEATVRLDGAAIALRGLFDAAGRAFRPPRGWVGNCEHTAAAVAVTTPR